MIEQKLILIRGLPGSAKSTLAKMLANEKCIHLEADMYFMVNGEYHWNASGLPYAHAWCQSRTDDELGNGNSVVVSNTFTTQKEVDPYLKIAKDHRITPMIILMQNDFGNVHNVPQEAINRMRDRFQYQIKME
jgi:predicted kinase